MAGSCRAAMASSGVKTLPAIPNADSLQIRHFQPEKLPQKLRVFLEKAQFLTLAPERADAAWPFLAERTRTTDRSASEHFSPLRRGEEPGVRKAAPASAINAACSS
jgi:hypothetical protein